MDKIDVSVIIPTYNVEDYLSDCLYSLINQTLKTIEIICVDDGSTDSTRTLLNTFKNKDERIKVFKNNQNQGQGFSRNVGLRYATGKYVLFLDSDDWLDYNSLEYLFNAAESYRTDILIYKLINYSTEFYKTNYYSVIELDDFTGKIFTYKDFPFFQVSNSPCNKLFLNSFLKNNNLTFPEGLIYEDNPFYFECITSAKKISIVDKHFYNRRRHGASTVARSDKKVMDILEICEILLNYFIEKGLYSDYKEELLNYIVTAIHQNFDKITESHMNEFFTKTKIKLNKFFNEFGLKNDFYNYLFKENLFFLCSIMENENYAPGIFSYKSVDVSVILKISDEDSLFKCLNNLINQSFQNFEIICLNDNEQHVRRVIDYFKEKHNNIRLVTNVYWKFLLKIALGEYIVFLEDTNWFDINALEKLFNFSKNNQLDLLMFNSVHYDENFNVFLCDNYSKTIKDYDKKIFNFSDINKEDLLNLPLKFLNQFFNKNFLENNRILDVGMDKLLIQAKILEKASRVSVLNEKLLNQSLCYEEIDLKKLEYLAKESICNNYPDYIKYYLFNKLIFEFRNILFSNSTENQLMYEHIKNILKYRKNLMDEKVLSYENLLFVLLIKKSVNQNHLKRLMNNLVNQYEISVIIPVYNAKKAYVARCFKSILKQTFEFEKIEIIFIDDCSTYLEGKNYIKQLIEFYPNVKGIFLDKNQGSGNARNQGIKNATGKYIMFLDHDDYYLENACKILYNTIESEDVDLVSGNFIFRGGTTIDWSEKNIPDYYTKVNKVTENLNFFLTPPAVYTKIFKKKFLIMNNLRFRNFKVGQDLVFMYETFFNADGIVFIDEAIMSYEIREETNPNLSSISINNSHKHLKTLIGVYKRMVELFIEFAPTKKHIPLGNDIPYWTTKRLFKSNLTYDEFKDIMQEGMPLFEEYERSENINQIEVCSTLFRDVLDNNYKQAYRKYQKYSGNS